MKANSKIETLTTDHLTRELATIDDTVSKGAVIWKNSKGERRSVPWSRVSRLGGFVGDRETDTADFDAYLAMTFKLQSEQKCGAKAENGAVAVKAGHSAKMGTANASVRVSKMDASKAIVACQVAACQKMQQRAHVIRAELARREAADKAAAEAATKAQDTKAIEEALMGKPVLAKAA